MPGCIEKDKKQSIYKKGYTEPVKLAFHIQLSQWAKFDAGVAARPGSSVDSVSERLCVSGAGAAPPVLRPGQFRLHSSSRTGRTAPQYHLIEPTKYPFVPPLKMGGQKAIIVGLSGCSSSGKTTLARLLRDIFPNSFVLHEDDFYRPEEE